MKIGRYSYPLFRLNALLKDTKTLHEKFERKEFTREHIAQILGQKVTSGGLGQKIADLRSYGLLSGGHGKYTVSETGIQATFGGNETEKLNALDKAVRNIELWMAIYKKCGIEPLPDTFWLDLADITGIARPESQNKANDVRKAYIEDIKYLLPVIAPTVKPDSEKGESETKPTAGARDRSEKVEATSATKFVHIKYPGYDAIIDLEDVDAFDVVENVLKRIKAKLTSTEGGT